MTASLTVALVSEVFFDDEDGSALTGVLRQAAGAGAELAVLPELPLNPWSPVSKDPREEDAEPPEGPRHRRMAEAARAAGIALVGGAIVVDPTTGTRHNTALVFDSAGMCRGAYRKVHLPEEEGYWETSHYEPGEAPPPVVTGAFPLALGLQICSDVNRPEGFQLLAAEGAELVCAPRATPPETYDRWRLVLRANAVMAGTYLISTNRPRPEMGAPIGGPSVAIDPFGEVLVETTEPLAVVTLERSVVKRAAGEYPGYLKRFPALYAEAWKRLS